jgi:zinc/manganese transport system substrate-binding protein
MNRVNPLKTLTVALLVLIGIVLILAASGNTTTKRHLPLKVVAGENFWGSLAAQLGGNKVQVLSIVSDPNADPHEYESNTTDAKAFDQADYVILNGAGYDSWGDKLLSSSPNPNRKELKVADLLGKKEGDNPHFWYSPTYVNTIVKQMEKDYIKLDPSDSAYFTSQYNALTSSLAPYQDRIKSMAKQFAGTKVAATEDIFAYLAQASGLNLISPPAFIQSVAEGNDPPAGSIVQFQQQLTSGEVKVLVYNQQTVTPLTDSIKKLAADNNVTVVGVTETIQPPDTSFQDWMNAELINLENALNGNALGH